MFMSKKKGNQTYNQSPFLQKFPNKRLLFLRDNPLFFLKFFHAPRLYNIVSIYARNNFIIYIILPKLKKSNPYTNNFFIKKKAQIFQCFPFIIIYYISFQIFLAYSTGFSISRPSISLAWSNSRPAIIFALSLSFL